MHFLDDVEKVTPKHEEPIVEQIPSNVVTHEDLETLSNAFKDSINETIRQNNEKFKAELIDFLKHEGIASDMLDNEQAKETEEPIIDEERKE